MRVHHVGQALVPGPQALGLALIFLDEARCFDHAVIEILTGVRQGPDIFEPARIAGSLLFRLCRQRSTLGVGPPRHLPQLTLMMGIYMPAPTSIRECQEHSSKAQPIQRHSQTTGRVGYVLIRAIQSAFSVTYVLRGHAFGDVSLSGVALP